MYVGDVQNLQTLTNHTSDVNAVDFAGDSILVTGSGFVFNITEFFFQLLYRINRRITTRGV